MDPKPHSSQEPKSQSHSQTPPPLNPTRNSQAMNNFRAMIIQYAIDSNQNRPLSQSYKSLIDQRFNHFFPDFYTPDHPPYPAMIETAIRKLNKEGGSSEEAISDFIRKEYDDLPWAHVTLLRHHLEKLCESGHVFVTTDKCYLLRDAMVRSNPGPSSDFSFSPSPSPSPSSSPVISSSPSFSSCHSSSFSSDHSPCPSSKRKKLKREQGGERGRRRGRPCKKNARGKKIQSKWAQERRRGRGRLKNYASEEEIPLIEEQIEATQIQDQVIEELIEIFIERNQDEVIEEQNLLKEVKVDVIAAQNPAQGQVISKQQYQPVEQQNDGVVDQNQTQDQHVEWSEEQTRTLKQQIGVICEQDRQQVHKVEIAEKLDQPKGQIEGIEEQNVPKEGNDELFEKLDQMNEEKLEVIVIQNQQCGQYDEVEELNLDKEQHRVVIERESQEQEGVHEECDEHRKQEKRACEEQNLPGKQQDDANQAQNQPQELQNTNQNQSSEQQSEVLAERDEQQEQEVERATDQDPKEEKRNEAIQAKTQLGGQSNELWTEILQSFYDGENTTCNDLMVLSSESSGSTIREGKKLEKSGNQQTKSPCGEGKMFGICGKQIQLPPRLPTPEGSPEPEVKPLEKLSWVQEEQRLYNGDLVSPELKLVTVNVGEQSPTGHQYQDGKHQLVQQGRERYRKRKLEADATTEERSNRQDRNKLSKPKPSPDKNIGSSRKQYQTRSSTKNIGSSREQYQTRSKTRTRTQI